MTFQQSSAESESGPELPAFSGLVRRYALSLPAALASSSGGSLSFHFSAKLMDIPVNPERVAGRGVLCVRTESDKFRVCEGGGDGEQKLELCNTREDAVAVARERTKNKILEREGVRMLHRDTP